MINLLIFGGGDFCLEVVSYLRDLSKFSKKKINLIGVVDPKKIKKKNIEAIYGKKIVHYFNLKRLNFNKKKTFSIVAVGDAAMREKCRKEIKKNGLKLFTLIHPKSHVANSSKIGNGCILAPFSLIAPQARLEENVFVNTYSSVGHHSFVGRSSVISPYATLNGRAHSGKISFLGTGSVIISKAKLGNQCKLSAGSILYKKTIDKCLVVGNPAEVMLRYK